MLANSVLEYLHSLAYWHWLMLGLGLLALEIVAGVTYFLWAGLAALLTGIVTLGLEPDWRLQVGMFSIFAFLLIVTGRRVARPGWVRPPAGDS